jgi:AmmeMemoRadiSam system protein B
MSDFIEIENIMKKKSRGTIIPHPGKTYGDDARNNSFRYFNRNTRYIIYVAALHRMKSNKNGIIYVLKKDDDFPSLLDRMNSNFTYKLDHAAKSEHSFSWVEKELRSYFSSDTKVLVIAPSLDTDLYVLSESIVKFLIKYKSSILISTSDLIHYGESYNTKKLLKFPQQQDKIKKEEDLINSLLKNDYKNVEYLVNNYDYLCCGPKSLIVFSIVSKLMGWTGKVTDYYDSHGKLKSQLLDRYVIDHKNVESFVSYVSIIYGRYSKQELKLLTKFDILQGIGLSKSVIYRNTIYNNKNEYKLFLPSWAQLRKKSRKNGIFVGTELYDEEKNKFNTNCSYGRFQDNETSIANKVTRASNDCYNDAKERWLIPYTKFNLDKMSYKLEILDEKNKWKKYNSVDVNKYFKLDGNHGMYLTIPPTEDNPYETSSTFLPVVAKDYKSIWDKKDYMENLSKKQNKSKNDWKLKESKMTIYKSKSYIWKLDKLIIL